MNILRFYRLFLPCALLLSANVVAQTQDTPTTYQVLSYMKVSPENVSEYLQLETAWKKIHAQRKSSGVLDGWELLRVASPYGANAEYNFVTRETYRGNAKLAAVFENSYMPENWMSLLNADEVALVERTSNIRTYVKREVWAEVAMIGDSDMSESKVRVINYFNHPEGKTRTDHFQMESELWVPIHTRRIEQGKMQAWVMAMLATPSGSMMPYQDFTVDVYDSMEDMLNTPYEELFKAVHPDLSMEEILERSEANADLVKSEIRMSIDGLN